MDLDQGALCGKIQYGPPWQHGNNTGGKVGPAHFLADPGTRHDTELHSMIGSIDIKDKNERKRQLYKRYIFLHN